MGCETEEEAWMERGRLLCSQTSNWGSLAIVEDTSDSCGSNKTVSTVADVRTITVVSKYLTQNPLHLV